MGIVWNDVDSGFVGGGRASADAGVVGTTVRASVTLVEIRENETVGPCVTDLVIDQFAVRVDSVTQVIAIPPEVQRGLLMSQAIVRRLATNRLVGCRAPR